MFNLFKKGPSFESTDKVWKTTGHAWRGLATDALKAITNGEIPMVLAFFDESKEQLMKYFTSQGVPYFDLKSETIADSAGKDKMVFCALAFQAEYLLNNSSIDKKKIHLLMESHYPLIAPEQRVLTELNALTGVNKFTFYVPIDGPLMKVFDMGNIIPLMEKLGLKDDECVQHNMISRSITRALEKINKSVNTGNEITTPSEQEWYAKNVHKTSYQK